MYFKTNEKQKEMIFLKLETANVDDSDFEPKKEDEIEEDDDEKKGFEEDINPDDFPDEISPQEKKYLLITTGKTYTVIFDDK